MPFVVVVVVVGRRGLTRLSLTRSPLRGTYAYCAPELYFGTRFTTKSDVYR